MNEFDDDSIGDSTAPEEKSKTQLKQESAALTQLGQTLVGFTKSQLATIPLDEEMLESIALANKINKKKDGYRRQLQYIGKLLRQRDTDPIRLAVHNLEAKHATVNKAFHAIELQRDSILQNGDEAIQLLMDEHPALDRQKLRQLYRQAIKEKANEKPPKAAREMFQYLKLTI